MLPNKNSEEKWMSFDDARKTQARKKCIILFSALLALCVIIGALVFYKKNNGNIAETSVTDKATTVTEAATIDDKTETEETTDVETTAEATAEAEVTTDETTTDVSDSSEEQTTKKKKETTAKTTEADTTEAITTEPQPIEIVGISISSLPTKKNYYQGDTLDTNGLVLTVDYSNGSSETICGGFVCSPITLNTAGKQTINVSYDGKNDAFEVNVTALSVTDVKIKTNPSKTIYLVGSSLKTSGLSLDVTYNSGATKTVSSGFTCNPTTLDNEGKQTISVTYEGKNISFDVDVLKVGGYFYFGNYEQDNNTDNGKEAIKWLVLEEKDGKILLISEYGLDAKSYHTIGSTEVTWETCALRKWLNEDFLSSAFSADEQKMIASTTLSADVNPSYSTNQGNETTDKVFLFSIAEFNKYLTGEDRKCVPTAYAKAKGIYSDASNPKNEENTSPWRLRTLGSNMLKTVIVVMDGTIMYAGYTNTFYDAAIRPAIWVNMG